VRIEGQYAVRHDDEWWMNNRNTIGKMQWIVDPSVEAPTPPLNDLASAAVARAMVAASALAMPQPAPTHVPPSTPSAPPASPPRSPGRVIRPPLPSTAVNHWWARALPWAGRVARGVSFFAFYSGGLGDGTLAGALRREAERIFKNVDDMHKRGLSETEIQAWHDNEWKSLAESQPQLFQPHVWNEVFPDAAIEEDARPQVGVTPGNVRVTSREEDVDEDKPCHVNVYVSRSMSPQSARHIEDAQTMMGKPRTLTIDRPGTRRRRAESLRGIPTIRGLDRDEYPPAVFLEGGFGASVRHIPLADNRSAGAQIGNQIRNQPDGCQATIITGP